MGWFTMGSTRFALCDKEDSDNFFSVRGNGWCMVCELEILDTYESEEAALQAIAALVRNGIIRERLVVTKVAYEFHKYSDVAEYDPGPDETMYAEKKDILPRSFTYDFDAAMQFKREMEKEIPGVFDKLSVVEMDKLIDFVYNKTIAEIKDRR